MISPTAIVGYLALFSLFGFSFLFANLLLGRILRPNLPNKEKLEVYECGEPTIGSSFVQFDLRFYVVALLFIIFDVEVAFFFPWAVVYGKATQLMDPNLPLVVQTSSEPAHLSESAHGLLRELGIRNPQLPAAAQIAAAPIVAGQGTKPVDQVAATELSIRDSARTMARLSLADIGVFFAVLLVGFAYVWKRGDLDWVRAVSRQRADERTPSLRLAEETVAA